jgi:predicted nucleic acid-binding protein
MKYLYDTNIVVYHVAGDKVVESFFDEQFVVENDVLVSSIARFEDSQSV